MKVHQVNSTAAIRRFPNHIHHSYAAAFHSTFIVPIVCLSVPYTKKQADRGRKRATNKNTTTVPIVIIIIRIILMEIVK